MKTVHGSTKLSCII